LKEKISFFGVKASQC